MDLLGFAEWTSAEMNLFDLFPHLTHDNHEITSPRTIKYNCIAWTVGNVNRWWQPGGYWPIEANRDDYGVGNLINAFRSMGFEECENGDLEDNIEKLAIYGSSLIYTHAARQLADGRWSSKLGQLEDIVHSTVEALCGSDYGEVVQFMKRRRIADVPV
jgi:hypothetical protein